MTPRSRIPIEGITHGTLSGYAQGCGCPPCSEAKKEYEAGRRAARPPRQREGNEDARTIARTVNVSPRVEALIEKQAGSGTFSGWVWEAILEKLERDTGDRDTARRRKPRRPNREPRTTAARTAAKEGQER